MTKRPQAPALTRFQEQSRPLRLGAALLLASAAGMLLPAAAGAQADDFAKVEMKATRVAGSVWMLEGAGGNIGASVGADGVLIVDDQFAPLAEKIRVALKEAGGGPLRFVLNTHFHSDHTGSNRIFGREASIIAHHNVRKRLATEQVSRRGHKVEASPREALPVITFDDALRVHFNGEEIDLLHVPRGHTDGDSVVFFTGSNVVHMGDQFFNGRFPYVDLRSGGSVEGYVKNVETVLARLPPGVKIIPGHGALATADDLEAFLAMLRETTAIVRARMKDGQTLEDMKRLGLPEQWKAWSSGSIDAEAWIETVYTSLTTPA